MHWRRFRITTKVITTINKMIYLFAAGVEKVFEFYYVTVLKTPHNLQFSVLKRKSGQLLFIQFKCQEQICKPWIVCLAALSWWPPALHYRTIWPGTRRQSCRCQWLWYLSTTLPAADRDPGPVLPPLLWLWNHLYLNE